MKPLRIFRHVLCEPPAYLGTFLQRRGIPFETVCLDEGLDVPDRLDGVAGLVFMGGPGSVNDPTDWIAQELQLIRRAEAAAMPVLGVCFGAQLISKALGGSVYPGENMEIGWHAVDAVNSRLASPWLDGLSTHFDVFQWHAHTFTLPPGAVPLWKSTCFEQQGFVKGPVLAMQFHLEVTAESVLDLTRRYASDLEELSECVQNVDQLSENLALRTSRLHRIADQIYERWLTSAGLSE